MPANYSANDWPFSARQCKSDVVPVTGLRNLPHCLRNPRGRKSPGSLIRHVPGESSGVLVGKAAAEWQEASRTHTWGKVKQQHWVTQRWPLLGDREQTEQWQQVQTARNMRGNLPSPSSPSGSLLLFRWSLLKLSVLRCEAAHRAPWQPASARASCRCLFWESSLAVFSLGWEEVEGRIREKAGRLLPKHWGAHTQPVASVIPELLCKLQRKVWNCYRLTNLYSSYTSALLRICLPHVLNMLPLPQGRKLPQHAKSLAHIHIC